MSDSIINDEMALGTLDRLSTETLLPRRLFQYEIQDDFQALLITISPDAIGGSELQAALLVIAETLRKLMPVRAEDYSWVVGVKQDGVVVESCFGGNLSIADWNGTAFVE